MHHDLLSAPDRSVVRLATAFTLSASPASPPRFAQRASARSNSSTVRAVFLWIDDNVANIQPSDTSVNMTSSTSRITVRLPSSKWPSNWRTGLTATSRSNRVCYKQSGPLLEPCGFLSPCSSLTRVRVGEQPSVQACWLIEEPAP